MSCISPSSHRNSNLTAGLFNCLQDITEGLLISFSSTHLKYTAPEEAWSIKRRRALGEGAFLGQQNSTVNLACIFCLLRFWTHAWYSGLLAEGIGTLILLPHNLGVFDERSVWYVLIIIHYIVKVATHTTEFVWVLDWYGYLKGTRFRKGNRQVEVCLKHHS